MTTEVAKYKPLENVLQNINKNYISISQADRNANNAILKELLDKLIIPALKETSDLFRLMYRKVFYGGSFYDDLRVGKPDEFDLDLLLVLPKLLNASVEPSNKPGHVWVKIKDYQKFLLQKSLAEQYKGLEKLMNDKKDGLDVQKVLNWMKSVVTKAFNRFKVGNSYVLCILGQQYQAKITESGPAFTLKLSKPGTDCVMDIDLVPCFVFDGSKWPEVYRPNPVSKKPEFFVVPKPLKDKSMSLYWRLSFQEQERELMNGLKSFKPTVKLLKKMRDTLNAKFISSYFIKTSMLWELEARPDKSFWQNNSLGYVFMTMLKEFQKRLETGCINYYWYKSNNGGKKNLLEGTNKETIINISNKLKSIINDIDRNLPGNPNAIAKHILNSSELMERMTN